MPTLTQPLRFWNYVLRTFVCCSLFVFGWFVCVSPCISLLLLRCNGRLSMPRIWVSISIPCSRTRTRCNRCGIKQVWKWWFTCLWKSLPGNWFLCHIAVWFGAGAISCGHCAQRFLGWFLARAGALWLQSCWQEWMSGLMKNCSCFGMLFIVIYWVYCSCFGHALVIC